MRIAHLDHVILGDDSPVQLQFLTLELLQQKVADVDGHDVEQLDLDFCLGIVPLDLGTHITNVLWLLEQSCHCLLARIHSFYVFLGGSFGLLQLFDSLGDSVPVGNDC